MQADKKHFRILRSGIWLQPLTMILVSYVTHGDWINMPITWLIFSCLPLLLIFVYRQQGSIKEDKEKPSATYPPVPTELLRDVPEEGDIVIGKSNGRYVCQNIKTDGHVLILGGSGSGKSSSIIIPTLLCNKTTPALVLDIKGELSSKAIEKGNATTRIFNPQDRSEYGYDPFYGLTDGSTEQERYETMQTVAFSLIPMSPSIKDPFWKNSARNMLIGMMLYHFRQGRQDLISIADAILGKPIQDSISEVMKNAKPTDMEFRFLVQFDHMSEETISGVFSEMANAIILFATDEDIRYALAYNPKKMTPKMIEEGNACFLVIREEKLAAYYNIVQLILNQSMRELEMRREDEEPVLFIIDELPRILSAGKLDRLLDACRTLRSRNVRMILVTQSLEALMIAYSENEAVDLMSNCSYKIVLDASSSKTQSMVCGWAGKYKELKRTVSGKNQRTASYEEKDILQPSDLMTLSKSGELILISPNGYNRIQKCFYFEDGFFKPQAEEIRRHNETINELKIRALVPIDTN